MNTETNHELELGDLIAARTMCGIEDGIICCTDPLIMKTTNSMGTSYVPILSFFELKEKNSESPPPSIKADIVDRIKRWLRENFQVNSDVPSGELSVVADSIVH